MSTTHRDVKLNDVQAFVENFLSGTLSSVNPEQMSYHLPKAHGEHKCRSGRFSRTWTGGSLTYYRKTGTLILRDASKDTGIGLKQLWNQFSSDGTAPWEKLQREPRAFDKNKKESGKYRGTQFQTIYKKHDYVDWMLGDGEDKCKNSLGMRMLFEYCKARRAQDEVRAGEQRPKRHCRIQASVDAQETSKMLQWTRTT
mmetsp:Transcript_47085/g.74322  ORF Transcript_47085/g.74322 Transcript_47085/m.74322 type:complete len:198 (-) Transcript_47085:163-756(-)